MLFLGAGGSDVFTATHSRGACRGAGGARGAWGGGCRVLGGLEPERIQRGERAERSQRELGDRRVGGRVVLLFRPELGNGRPDRALGWCRLDRCARPRRTLSGRGPERRRRPLAV